MKRIILSAFCILFLTTLHAQTYTAGHISVTVVNSMNHDSTICATIATSAYNITVDSSYTGDTLYIVDTATAGLIGSPYINTTGISPWVFTANIFGGGYGDYDISGIGFVRFNGPTTKIVCGADTLRYITIQDSLLVTNPCSYGTIAGNVYTDNNGNCVFDSGDVGIYSPPVNVTEYLSSFVDSGSYYSGYSSGSFYNYVLQQSWMTSYKVFLPPYYSFIFPNSACFAGSYTFTTLPQVGVDFPLECTSNVDVECYASSPAAIRLSTPFLIHPCVNNTGCDTVSGELTLVMDSRAIYNPLLSTLPADTVHGDTLIWNYHSLNSLSGGAYWNSFFSNVYLTLDSTVTVGDTLCFRVYTNIPPTDVNPSNNDYTLCLPVVYSYDPNEKEVSPAGTGPQGYIPAGTDTLAYNIHFQNTGSDVAYNITITDTLDSHINPASLRITGSTHYMTPQWLAPGVLQFNFNGIYLPDSASNEAGSQGEVRFTVALNPSLAPGTQIKNTAYIYFDTNPAVVTNTTLNTIEVPSKIDPLTTASRVKVYPNPATDHIYVENLSGGTITIVGVNGATILNQSITNNMTTIDVSSIPLGIYILKTISNTNTTTTKFIKY